jgi:RHS repeat-associated protein
MRDKTNRWCIGERVNGQGHDLATLAETIETGQWYGLEVVVAGDTATLKVGGVTKVSHTFGGGIGGGRMGLLVLNAHSHFDDVWAQEVVSERKYYLFNGQRVALRKDGMVYYLLGDHLGSTSLVADAEGNKLAENRYYPYGEERLGSGTLPTDYRFTGQRVEQSLGIYAMGARWYDPALGRWSSPDTVVPDPVNPQSLNRYSYTRNNPVKFRDPSGHMEIYGGNPHEAYSDYWYTYVNPKVPGCQSDLEFIKQGSALAVDFTPGAGDLKGLAEVFTGRDVITGESLGNWRWLGLIGLSEVRYLRHADEALAVVKAFGKIAEGLDTIFHNIRPFKDFLSPRTPSGWHAHHLVEKRFWRQLGFGTFEEGRDNILSVMLPNDFHIDDITSQIRKLIPNTATATLQGIWDAHKQVYMQYEWGEDWLNKIWETYFAETDVVQ